MRTPQPSARALVTLGDVIWHDVTMPDSGALRQQRYKHHRAGDHHLCRHDTGQIAQLAKDASFAPADDFDAAAELARLAGRLRDAYAADPGNASLARELRMTLLALREPGDKVDPEIAEFLTGLANS
jgi:hypothetical protein